jgi:ubiquinone/menaquinone biosynthesis C-methylase UbiE
MWTRERYKWFYDNLHSRYYDRLMKWCFLPFGGERRLREALIEEIAFAPGERILDMCCGTGGATVHLAARTGPEGEVVGMDLSAGQVAAARRRRRMPNARFVEGDVARTGFPDGSFDKVFITHALHEMRRELRVRVLAEAGRVLKEGGEAVALELGVPQGVLRRLFIAFWFFQWLPFNFEIPTLRDMLAHGLDREMEQAGLRDVRRRDKFHGVFQVVSGRKAGRAGLETAGKGTGGHAVD